MQGQMMTRPLSIIDILTFARDAFGGTEIVSARVEGDIHRQTYAETHARVAGLARGLVKLGVAPGDRIATLAWNGHRHLELYYAISGIGAVCHTLNPRLPADQMRYIIDHAEDEILFLDPTFVPLIENIRDQLPGSLRFVIMAGADNLPENSLNAPAYEDILEGGGDFDWPEFDENTASGLCYTSGTTGVPKGTLYSHRSTVLHAMMAGVSFQNCLNPRSKVLPVVPLFHVNAWGLPHAAPLTGAGIVFPGPNLDGASLWNLMDSEKVWSAWGVPTVWTNLLAEIRKRGGKPAGFGDVVIGGSAAPRGMIEEFENMGVSVCHAWGMTEMSPIGTQGALPPPLADLPLSERIDLKVKQGRRTFGVEMKIVDGDGNGLPHDGVSAGELHVRGNCVASGYFRNPEAGEKAIDSDGWFATGDIASIDDRGFLAIADRAKDMIKSGGEWISSLEIEDAVLAHPSIAQCAVIAVPHEKWGERPLLVAVCPGDRPSKREIIDFIAPKFAKWQLPDDVVFADELPLTATGKVSKLTLRRVHGGHVQPDA